MKPGQRIARGTSKAKRPPCADVAFGCAPFSTAGLWPAANDDPDAEIGEAGKQRAIGGVIQRMTVLGATIYLGFFVLAALWLFVTAEGAETDQDQLPERSNSDSTDADTEVSSPWALSQSASK